MTVTQTRTLFYSAALFNWVAAGILFAPFGAAAALGLEPLPAGSPYEQIAAAAIVLFGIGYWWAAIDPVTNRALIRLGMIGKIIVVLVVLLAVASGDANWRLGGIVSGDLVYAVLFARYLATSGRDGQRRSGTVSP